MDELTFDSKVYISSKKAAKLTGYTTDYIGQLCRLGKLPSKMVGRNRYIEKAALPRHKRGKETEKATMKVDELKELKVQSKPTLPERREIHATRPQYAPRVGESIRPRYPSHVVSNALSLSYEQDARPLYPSLERRQVLQTQTVTPVAQNGPSITRRVVSIRHAPYSHENVRQPLSHYSPKHVQRNKTISSRREIKTRQYKKNRKHSKYGGTSIIIVLALVLAIVSYASFIVTETLVYGEGLKGIELKVRAIDLF